MTDLTALEPIEKLKRDLRAATATITPSEARYLVDLYYSVQKTRIRADNQVRAMEAEPHSVIAHFGTQYGALERQIRSALDVYSAEHPVGKWARAQKGVGPVLAAGLLAHIDIKRAPTVGHIWRFAGLDPTVTWDKGEKRPWNASLKVVCWKLGESFVKVSGDEDAFYGRVYAQRKRLEQDRNFAGQFAEQAAASLAAKRFGADTVARKAYEDGRLPDARLHLRAQRVAVKLFLAHLHEVWFRHEFGVAPPLPYPVAHLGHAHVVPPPTVPSEEEFEQMLDGSR